MPRRLSSTLIVLLVAASLVAAGCSGPREATGELPSTFPNDSFAEIRQALAQGTDTLRAFRSRASLSVDTPDLSGTFSARIRARRGAAGDSLYLSVSPGLGVEAARMLITPDSFFVYDAVRNELKYGALSDAGSALPAPLRTGDAFENLLGLTTPRSSSKWDVRASTPGEGQNRYVLTNNSGARERTLVVDPARWRVLRYAERTGETLVEERVFSEFDRFGGLFLPRRAELRRPRENSDATVRYRRLTLNPGDLPPFALSVPNGARRTLVGR